MDNNISETLKKELEKLLDSKFFYREPSNNKVIAYSISFLLLILLGSLLKVELLTAFLAVFPLTYVLGAKGLKFYVPLATVGIAMLVFLSSPHMLFWFVMHMLLAYLIYQSIVKRYSKVYLLIIITTFLFIGIAFYIVLLIKYGVITINHEEILKFIDNYSNVLLTYNQSIDKSMILSSFENMQREFPVTLFCVLFIYSLALLQYTLSMLSKEYIIIPTFPKLSRIMISTKTGYIYITITLVYLIVESMMGANSYNFWYILLQNLTNILSWIFVLNGLFTAFFFIERKGNSPVTKALAVIGIIIFSSIFELVGFVDSLFRLRETYIIKKGE